MKNKIISIIKIVFINIILFLFFLVIIDFLIFTFIPKSQDEPKDNLNFKYLIKNPPIWLNDFKFKNINDIDVYKRRFAGLEYKDKNPIVIFGCSFAYGDALKYNQTFGYKLSHYLKVPVYNRAMSGGGPAMMYAQTLSPDFYNEVPKTDNVIYVIIVDHYRRMTGDLFSIFDSYFYIHYKLKNGKFIMDNYNNYILNFFRSSYTIRYIYHSFMTKYVEDEKNAEKLANEILLYFVKMRDNMEKHWGNKINFTIVFYDSFSDILEEKLKENNFYIIKISDLTNEDLSSPKYKFVDNGHPTETAWDFLTPMIAEKLVLLNK